MGGVFRVFIRERLFLIIFFLVRCVFFLEKETPCFFSNIILLGVKEIES